MKKRMVIFLLVISILILPLSVYGASQKIVSSGVLVPIKINSVDLIGGNINVLVESQNNNKVYLAFDVKYTDGLIKRYYVNTYLNSYEAKYFSVSLDGVNPTYLYVTPYLQSGNIITLYENSKETYVFSGSEYKTTSDTSVASAAQIVYLTLSPAIFSTSSSSEDKTIYSSSIYEIKDKEIDYLHSDYLSSVRSISDSSAVEILKQDYNYFGSMLSSKGYSLVDSDKKAFTSKENDRSGLSYYGARYYNALTGRFVSVDPLYKPDETPYDYAKSNPLKFVDPSGEDSIDNNCGQVCDFGKLIYGSRESALADITSVGGEITYGPRLYEAPYDVWNSASSTSGKLFDQVLGREPKNPHINTIIADLPISSTTSSIKNIKDLIRVIKNFKNLFSFNKDRQALQILEKWSSDLADDEILLFRGLSQPHNKNRVGVWWSTNPYYSMHFAELGANGKLYVAKVKMSDIEYGTIDYQHVEHDVYKFLEKDPSNIRVVTVEEIVRLKLNTPRAYIRISPYYGSDAAFDNSKTAHEITREIFGPQR